MLLNYRGFFYILLIVMIMLKAFPINYKKLACKENKNEDYYCYRKQ